MNVLYPAFYRHVLHPIYHAVKRDGFNAVEREALATDMLDAAGLARLQRAKFSRLQRDARAQSPYYREVIDAGAAEAALDGTPPHELGLPFLTKAVIRERLEDIVAADTATAQLIATGTGGEPVRFHTDPHAGLWHKSVAIRNRRWVGVPIGERAAILWGLQIDNYE